jgi:hypothetical protein
MVENPEYIALIQPVAGLPEVDQRRLVAKFEPTDYFLIGKDGDHDDFLKIMRPPRVALVSHAGLLGEQHGKKLDRADSMAATKAALHKRGSHAVEATTGRTSLKKWAAMRKDGDEMCRRLSQGAKSALNGRRGNAGYTYTDKDMLTMLRIMDSPRYSNDDKRIHAIREHDVRPVPKRTWLLTKLKVQARERGLLK